MLQSNAPARSPTPAMSGRDCLALAFVAVFGAVNASYSYRLGFDWGDLSSYALIARDLLESGSPADYVGYGPLWHFWGAWLFQVTGIDFSALLIAFNLLIIASALLLLMAVRSATGRVWPGLLVGLAVICVPPLLASTMRLLCLALFAWPFVALAGRAPADDRPAVLATGSAIGAVLMMRPDFAYLFAALLAVLLVWRAVLADVSLAKRLSYAVSRGLLAGAAALVLMLPLAFDAVRRGYGWHLLSEILDYPKRLLLIFASSGAATAEIPKPAPSLIRMPPLGAILDPASGQQVFALLVYSSFAGLVVVAALLGWRALRDRGAARCDQAFLALFLLAASQLPIFVLFRPSWGHFVSFMHGYLLLAAGLLAWCAQRWVAVGLAARLGIAPLLAQLVLFAVYGLIHGNTGLVTRLAGRDQVVELRNGVRFRATPAEKRIYENIVGIIEQNSRPGDRIVCVPYCPGFALMTDRRSLFARHYVDDSTPLVEPGWLDKAIALTDEVRPPVVIVLDWAPNDTEASRFDVWARRYVDHVARSYPVSGRFEMGTVWLRDDAGRPALRRVEIVDWGPKSARVGEAFNRQPNGQSAIWLRLGSDAGGGATIRLDGRDLPTFTDGVAVTALVPQDLLSRPRALSLQVVDPLRNIESQIVTLEIAP